MEKGVPGSWTGRKISKTFIWVMWEIERVPNELGDLIQELSREKEHGGSTDNRLLWVVCESSWVEVIWAKKFQKNLEELFPTRLYLISSSWTIKGLKKQKAYASTGYYHLKAFLICWSFGYEPYLLCKDDIQFTTILYPVSSTVSGT